MSAPRHTGPSWLFCVGAQKAGTTWLYDYLSAHPGVHVPPVKELHYFNTAFDPAQWEFIEMRRATLRAWEAAEREGRPLPEGGLPGDVGSVEMLRDLVAMHDAPGEDHAAYRRLMTQGAGEAACIADITPDYSVLSGADFARMAADFPDAKFLCILRDPVSRTWSHIKMQSKWLAEQYGVERSEDELIDMVMVGYHAHIMTRSAYDALVDNLSRNVPADRVLFLFYEELFSDAAMRRLCDFIGVPFRPGDYGNKVRGGEDRSMTEAQRKLLRRLTAPVYRAMIEHFGDTLPQAWDLEAAKASPIKAGAPWAPVVHRPRGAPAGDGTAQFIGIAAPETGRHRLQTYLNQHPEVFTPLVQDIGFFSAVRGAAEPAQMARRIREMENRLMTTTLGPVLKPLQNLAVVGDIAMAVAVMAGRLPYAALFDARGGRHKAWGEVSGDYGMLDAEGVALVRDENPGMKAFFVLRDPVERFLAAVGQIARQRPELAEQNGGLDGLAMAKLTEREARPRRLAEAAATVAAFDAGLPADQLHYLFFEDLFGPTPERRAKALRGLTDFLGIGFAIPGAGFAAETVAERPDASVSGETLVAIRQEFAGEYRQMRRRFGAMLPAEWWCEAPAEAVRPASAREGGAK